MGEATSWFDLIAAATGTLREGLARVGIATAAGARIGPARSGDALLTGLFAPSRDGSPTACDRLTTGLAEALATPSSSDLPALHIDGPVIAGHPFVLRVDSTWLMRAIGDLPDRFSPPPFPASAFLQGGREQQVAIQIAILRTHAAITQAALSRPPPWMGTCDAASRPLLRCLLGAARAFRDGNPSLAWVWRLSTALDAQWNSAPGSVMRLIEPHDVEATRARLALAGRAAAILARVSDVSGGPLSEEDRGLV